MDDKIKVMEQSHMVWQTKVDCLKNYVGQFFFRVWQQDNKIKTIEQSHMVQQPKGDCFF
jgi:hypothetical protein